MHSCINYFQSYSKISVKAFPVLNSLKLVPRAKFDASSICLLKRVTGFLFVRGVDLYS